MRTLLLPFQRRYLTLTIAVVATLSCFAAAQISPLFWVGFVPAALLSLLGLHDIFQRSHSVLRNYPIAAHFRFLLEKVRPEIRQYFLEDDSTGSPFARKKRAVVYRPLKPGALLAGTQATHTHNAVQTE